MKDDTEDFSLQNEESDSDSLEPLSPELEYETEYKHENYSLNDRVIIIQNLHTEKKNFLFYSALKKSTPLINDILNIVGEFVSTIEEFYTVCEVDVCVPFHIENCKLKH